VATEPLVLGIDVGGTKVAAAAVVSGRPEHAVEHPTDLTSTDALLGGIEAAAREVISAGGEAAAVGIGVPSQIEWESGRVVASVNIPLEGVPLREELGRRLGAPVYVDNDANCAALAEAHLVEDGPARYLVMFTLGTGVGGGVVIDGRIFRGAHGLGAELGHVVIEKDGPNCPGACPNRGCLEALCSGTALERDASELARDRPDSALAGNADKGGRVKGRQVVDAARAGDGDAIELLRRLGANLGVGIAGAVNTFEPEYVVVGGGLSAAAELFIEEAKKEAGSRALPALWNRVRVSIARGGPAAGVIGAGILALQEHLRSEDTAT
jgi:glucokinase